MRRIPRLDATQTGRVKTTVFAPESSVLGSREGIDVFVVGEPTNMASNKAPSDGTYRLGKGNFQVRKGGFMPDGAEFTAKDLANEENREALVEQLEPTGVIETPEAASGAVVETSEDDSKSSARARKG